MWRQESGGSRPVPAGFLNLWQDVPGRGSKKTRGLRHVGRRHGLAQICAVFGQPRTSLEASDADVIHGNNGVEAKDAHKMGAWFLDVDCDCKVFCICQAFFLVQSALEKLPAP